MLSVEMMQALLFVIGFYTNHDPAITHELNQVIVNGVVNPNALSNLENLIIQRQMRDVLQIMRQTLRGNFDRLQEHRAILDQFYNECSDRETEWPLWCYHYTQTDNAVVQEVNGNVETKINQPCENSDQPTARSQGDYENESSSQVPPEEPGLPQPSGPLRNFAPTELSQRPYCCRCGKNIQEIGTSCPMRITDFFKRLTPKQWQRFVKEINDYNPAILGSIKSQLFTSPVTADAFTITLLQHQHLSGKCLLCLLHDVFKRIGRSDLADQLRNLHKKS